MRLPPKLRPAGSSGATTPDHEDAQGRAPVGPAEDGFETAARGSAVQKNSERLFRITAPIYDRLTNHELWRRQNVALLEHLPARVDHALDLGCGTGVGTLAVAEALPAHTQVVGLDLTPGMIERARGYQAESKLGAERVRFEVGDATAMRFPDGAFDAVMANSFLYLVPEPDRVLAEIHRVLRPGGRFVTMEPHRDGSLVAAAWQAMLHPGGWIGSPGSAAWLGAAMTSWRVVSGLAGRRPVDAQLELLREAGFEEVYARPTLGGLGVHLVGEKAG